MLSELRLTNLKAFQGAHEIGLAPLTLIYGSNSAGKSTLIQTLLLLKQTIESSDPEQPALVARGTLADLGSVPGIIHGHDLSRRLEIGVSLTPPRRSIWSHRLGPEDRRYDFSFVWDADARAVRQTGARFGLGTDDIAVYTRRRGPAVARTPDEAGRRDYPFRLGRRAAREKFVRWMLSGGIGRWQPRGLSRLSDVNTDETVEALVDRVSFAAAPWSILPAFPDFNLRESGPTDERLGEILEALERSWRSLSMSLRGELSETLDSLVYLGPLRRAPARFHLVSGARRTSVGREGEFAAEILSRRPELVEQVNVWLDRLNIPYSIDATMAIEEDVSTTLGDVVVLVLTDRRSGLNVSPGDVGFGISQLLPIVVQTLVGAETIICIEQPEIHVHPRLQAEVADLFVEGVRAARSNQLIVETHSEHLMLRLQRHIKHGRISADDLAVLYVDTDEHGKSSVLRLRLDGDGSFIDEWPHGFFEERLDEVFQTD